MDIKTIRRTNLQRIIDADFKGNATKCAEVLGMKVPQVHSWITDNIDSRQGMSETSARRIEERLRLPYGSLDVIHSETNNEDEDDAVIGEFAWVYRNATEVGKEFLRSTLYAARAIHVKTDQPKPHKNTKLR